MNPKLKLTAYAVLLILCVWFGWGFYANYSAVTKTAADSDTNAPVPAPETSTNASTITNVPANTNALANSAPATNANESAATPGTNVAGTPETNAPPTQTKPLANAQQATPATAPGPQAGSRQSAMVAYLAALIGAFICLGLLIAMDMSRFVGAQAVEFLFSDAGEGLRDPDYERAEAEWSNGKYLEAIQTMRDFLKEHPREIYAALRIAEIYEKDLKNHLAAALEYEEILKQKLPAERWGWAAVHLCNLYSKLNQSDKALALLRRVAEEYPKTGAAKKARARLGLAEPEPEEAAEEAIPEAESETTDGHSIIYMEERPPELEPRTETPRPPPGPPASSEPPKPSLPPGFRPKE